MEWLPALVALTGVNFLGLLALWVMLLHLLDQVSRLATAEQIDAAWDRREALRGRRRRGATEIAAINTDGGAVAVQGKVKDGRRVE